MAAAASFGLLLQCVQSVRVDEKIRCFSGIDNCRLAYIVVVYQDIIYVYYHVSTLTWRGGGGTYQTKNMICDAESVAYEKNMWPRRRVTLSHQDIQFRQNIFILPFR